MKFYYWTYLEGQNIFASAKETYDNGFIMDKWGLGHMIQQIFKLVCEQSFEGCYIHRVQTGTTYVYLVPHVLKLHRKYKVITF